MKVDLDDEKAEIALERKIKKEAFDLFWQFYKIIANNEIAIKCAIECIDQQIKRFKSVESLIPKTAFDEIERLEKIKLNINKDNIYKELLKNVSK